MLAWTGQPTINLQMNFTFSFSNLLRNMLFNNSVIIKTQRSAK